jgi:hypothetical protein
MARYNEGEVGAKLSANVKLFSKSKIVWYVRREAREI